MITHGRRNASDKIPKEFPAFPDETTVTAIHTRTDGATILHVLFLRFTSPPPTRMKDRVSRTVIFPTSRDPESLRHDRSHRHRQLMTRTVTLQRRIQRGNPTPRTRIRIAVITRNRVRVRRSRARSVRQRHERYTTPRPNEDPASLNTKQTQT